MLRAAAEDGTLPIDVLSYPLYQLADRLRADVEPFRSGYAGRVRDRRAEDYPRRIAAGEDRLADRAVPGSAARGAGVVQRHARCSRTATSTGWSRTASPAAFRCSRTRTATPPQSR